MKMEKFLKILLGIFLVVSFFAIFILDHFDIQTQNGKTIVFAQFSPISLILIGLLVFFYVWILNQKLTVDKKGIPSRRRRLVAFCFIDLTLVIIFTTVLNAVLALWIEAGRTGHFAWNFFREQTVNTDWCLFWLRFVFMFFYFALPLLWAKPTFGQYLMGIIVTVNGKIKNLTPFQAFNRTFWELIGFTLRAVIWPIYGIVLITTNKDPQGLLWHDKRAGTRVLFLKN